MEILEDLPAAGGILGILLVEITKNEGESGKFSACGAIFNEQVSIWVNLGEKIAPKARKFCRVEILGWISAQGGNFW